MSLSESRILVEKPTSPQRLNSTTTRVEATAKVLHMSTRALTQRETDNVRRAIRNLIDECGSQLAAARKIGISQQVLSRINSGDPAGLYVAKKVAAARRVPLAELLSPLPALDALVAANPDRWRTWTVSAVRTAPGVESLDENALRRLLDRVESVLSPAFDKLPK